MSDLDVRHRDVGGDLETGRLCKPTIIGLKSVQTNFEWGSDLMLKRSFNSKFLTALAGGMTWLCATVSASAAGVGEGHPEPWQSTLQAPVTEVARGIHDFYNLTNTIIVSIAIFVGILLAYVMIKFRASANPTPSKTTHNAMLEFAWTAIPILILLIIAIPSFKLLFLQYSFPKADLVIKATGYQWYWGHEYPDQGGFSFDSAIVRDEDLLTKEMGEDKFAAKFGSLEGEARTAALYKAAKPLWEKSGKVRQLSVDNEVVVPVGKVVHVLITAEDVIHNWTIPSFGSKVDAVPGRVTATWFRAEKKGIYYGQCSELCGADHASMPIAVRVVDQGVFNAWAAAMKADDSDKAQQILKQAAINDAAARKFAAVKAVKGIAR